jgi:pimeloyl-ACP methyl ester carboxylesterase
MNGISLFLLTVSLLGSSVSLPAKSKDVVWFPNPKGDGTLIPAHLTPTTRGKAGDVKDIHFRLYTRENPDQFDELYPDQLDSIDNSHFQTADAVKVLSHGFGGNYSDSFPWALMKAYMDDTRNTERYNVILIDWSALVVSPDYFSAVANAQIASQYTADLLKFLVDQGKTTWDKIHIIGFSLGGQLVGQIGNRVQKFGGGAMIERITSLDPALPLFDVAHEDNKTTPDDAKFVEVIHTAANGILGYWDPLGHVDWYPNGGRYQPGCGADVTGSCGHGRAPAYYTESVGAGVGGAKEFWGRKCPNYDDFQSGACDSNAHQIMGWTTPTSAENGTYFLATESAAPYALGPLQ